MIKPLLAHTDHHLSEENNQEKLEVQDRHDHMKHQEKNNKQVEKTVTQPVLIKNDTILQSNLIASLTLGEYIFFAMINTPFVLYLIKRKILR